MGPCAPGSYLASVRPLPYGYYLKSAKLGDRDVLGGIDLTSGGGGRLELVVSGKGGRVSGLVKDESGSAAAGATVVLIPENTVLRTSYSLFPRVTADATGAFTVNSVPPGNYKAFAWADWEGFAYMNAEYMRPIEGKGVALKVEESGSYTASLQTIPASGVTP
jgi:hypothetical protein